MEFPQNFQSGRETNREPLWIDHMDRIEFDLQKTKTESGTNWKNNSLKSMTLIGGELKR